MKEILAFLVLYRIYIVLITLTITSIFLIVKNWEKIKFSLMCFWISCPIFGNIAKLYKKTTMKDRWFDSEKVLCGKFYKYYITIDKDPKMYDNSISYLNKVDEIDRTPFPFFAGVIIFLLVILEALGFAYVLAGYTIPGASESLQQKGALGIAFVISIILVGFTHFTGGEIYKNSLKKKIREYFSVEKQNQDINLIPNSKVTLENNHFDDNEPRCKQILNRLKGVDANITQKWYITIITAILITLIAIGATYVRGQVLEKQLNQEISNVTTNVYDSFPSEISNIQSSADNQALQEQQSADRKGGWATFIVLAILFTFIQILGIILGYKWGFEGKQSKEAYKYSHNFISKDEFENFYNLKKDKIVSIANEKLSILQQKMSNFINTKTINSKDCDLIENKYRTFENFIKEKKAEESNRKIDEAINKKKQKVEIERLETYANEAKNIEIKKREQLSNKSQRNESDIEEDIEKIENEINDLCDQIKIYKENGDDERKISNLENKISRLENKLKKLNDELEQI